MFWSQGPPDTGISLFQVLLQGGAHELLTTDTHTLNISPVSQAADSAPTPLQLVCDIVHSSSPYALSLHLDARALLSGILLQASPLITRLSIKDVGTLDVLTLVAQVAAHIQELTVETSSQVDRKLGSSFGGAVTPFSFPYLDTLYITSDCPSSLQALTNLVRLSPETRVRINCRDVRSQGSIAKFIESLLSDRTLMPPTLYLNVESQDHTQLRLCSDPELGLNSEDVPVSHPDGLQPLVDVSFEWHASLSVYARSRLNDTICNMLSRVSPGIKNVVLAFGHLREDAIDLYLALVHLADSLQTLVLRGDWEYAMEALKLILVPDLHQVVLEDDVRLSTSTSLDTAVRVVHPVFNDMLNTMGLGAKVYVGGERIFAHRSSAFMWDIVLPEDLWLMWNESTIISFYEPVSDETQKAADDAYDEWIDEVYLPGKGGSETFEPVEQAIVEQYQREQDEQDAMAADAYY
ncbi:hypothetical protein PENSPDRAFT_732448 [Peniophora sp. CONT]|nr:hypothetical protein PENSPDRAFT_732448 [Peniophora sp. CONT]